MGEWGEGRFLPFVCSVVLAHLHKGAHQNRPGPRGIPGAPRIQHRTPTEHLELPEIRAASSPGNLAGAVATSAASKYFTDLSHQIVIIKKGSGFMSSHQAVQEERLIHGLSQNPCLSH